MNDTNRLEQNNSKYKLVYVLLFSVLPFCWFLYSVGPNVVFYFDKIEGVGFITNINKQGELEFYYKHKVLNKKVELISGCYKKEKLRVIAEQEDVDILYSRYFPEMVVLIDYDQQPDFILSLLLILIWTIPMFFYKEIKLF